jgi:hypothetical protein
VCTLIVHVLEASLPSMAVLRDVGPRDGTVLRDVGPRIRKLGYWRHEPQKTLILASVSEFILMKVGCFNSNYPMHYGTSISAATLSTSPPCCDSQGGPY